MIEQYRRTLLAPVRSDLDTFQHRASHRRHRHKRSNRLIDVRTSVLPLLATPFHLLSRLPSRYFLHFVIALLVPLALVLSQFAIPAAVETGQQQPALLADAPLGLGPISLDGQDSVGVAQVGDPPLIESDALPMPLSLTSRSEALAPLAVPATVAGDTVKLRNGPGLEYDDVARLDGGAAVEVIGRFGDWFQVRQANGQPIYWLAGELLNMPDAATYTLFEVPQEAIPPPPPPKVATVREEGLSLRDGPGTNYIKMSALKAGETLSLVEQYQGWMHVATDSYDGWVSAEFLAIGDGILHRVPETATIPDPNPSLIGAINDNSVNLRQGPGTVYGTAGKIDAGSQVDLLARHKDWYKIQLGDGTKAWVFSELMDVAPMAQRRVPFTNDIPAPPAPVVRGGGGGGATSSGGGGGGGGGAAVGIPASGDVAGFATQFVGYRYVYGGASPGSGFDCSGLTSYVYRQFGVNLPHSSAAQFSTAYGAMVGSMGNLAPGDLVFFAGTAGPGISHVAIYIGGGRIVHAMTYSLGVQVSNIYDSYWANHYYGAIRVRR